MSRIKVVNFDLDTLPLQARMPFRYGIVTMTRVTHLFFRLSAIIDGTPVTGISADLLAVKWFTKDPNRPVEEETAEMLRVIEHAGTLAKTIAAESVFDFWLQLYEVQEKWAQNERLPSLLAHFGTSLVERGVIDAFCRIKNTPFHVALEENAFQIRLSSLHPELTRQPRDYLPSSPLQRVIVRHTVGLADPLTESEIPAVERLEDGLPQSLEASVRANGLRHFKIKVAGDPVRDLERLRSVTRVLGETAPQEFAWSLDGNEQFETIEAFREFWQSIQGDAGLRPLLNRLLFVEQPLHRKVALSDEVAAQFSRWPDRPAMIIDESDATLGSLRRALDVGYAGTSHKNCKGVFKSIANRCLLRQRAANPQAPPALMSGEDLCNIGPVALFQDLAVAAALGIQSVERNGHHYFRGLSMFPPAIQKAVSDHHADLYKLMPAGWPSLRIEHGEISLASVNAAPFGVARSLHANLFQADCA